MAARALRHIGQAGDWKVYTATVGWFARTAPFSAILTSEGFPGQRGWGIPTLQPTSFSGGNSPTRVYSEQITHRFQSAGWEATSRLFQIPDSTTPRETGIWFPVSICIGFQKEPTFPPCVNLRHQVPFQQVEGEKTDNVKDDAKLKDLKQSPILYGTKIFDSNYISCFSYSQLWSQ